MNLTGVVNIATNSQSALEGLGYFGGWGLVFPLREFEYEVLRLCSTILMSWYDQIRTWHWYENVYHDVSVYQRMFNQTPGYPDSSTN